jgi:DNA-binding beta-propeller fold protein YncE
LAKLKIGPIVAIGVLAASSASPYLSPTALAATANGKTLFIACATANRVLRLDAETRLVTGQ